MKTIQIILIFAIFNLSITGIAQVEQVSVSANYTDMVFYKISTGETTTISNDAWDIAFSREGLTDAGVFINEAGPYAGTALELHLANTTDWALDITNTSVYIVGETLYNPEENWTEGAFNTIKDINNPFDYGWGIYNTQNNIVEGSKIFIIKKRDESFLKLQIVELSNNVYTFKYADLDGNNEKIVDISKDEVENGLIYFSFSTETTVDIPQDFDLIFQRYITPSGPDAIEYPVTGILSNAQVEIAVADGVSPDEVNEANYADAYTANPKAIGVGWKNFDFDLGWVIKENLSYFVKTVNGDKYQLIFYDFDGTTTGTTIFEKKLIEENNTYIREIDNVKTSLYPNPVSEYIMIEGTQRQSIKANIIGIEGKTVYNGIITNNKFEIPTNWANGYYSIRLNIDGNIVNKKIIINK